jgi:bifunctional non-homologous end joining protein LigD
VLLGIDGIPDFNGLHSRKHDEDVQLHAFDILALDGADLRKLPLHLRKTNLARLLARRPEGIFVSDFERGEIGPEKFAVHDRTNCLRSRARPLRTRKDDFLSLIPDKSRFNLPRNLASLAMVGLITTVEPNFRKR